MSCRERSGFTLIEVLVALAVISVAVAALAMIQVVNLRASVSARAMTTAKSAANSVLEDLMAEILETQITTTSSGTQRHFNFDDYYWSCPTYVVTSGAVQKACTGSTTLGDIDVVHRIQGESGVLGEGIVTVAVTATHSQGGQSITLGDRVTCYDVYPSPSATAPEPCPQPTSGGGGR